MFYTAKIEQTRNYSKRMRYIPATDSFTEKEYESLSYAKGVPYPSGWLKESGTPPCEHLDVIVVTDSMHELGDEIRVRVIGVFVRLDGDHKLAAVPAEREIDDISGLDERERGLLEKLYPALFSKEGWFGRERAEEVINGFFSRKKRKFIITVQHTESQHHLNDCIGAWQDWELTERGREQARQIGKWLLWEDCDRAYNMFVSPQKRALQTVEEINGTLGITPAVRDALREVNAGVGNGKSRQWYREHEAPRGDTFDPDYKPFPDAESDRELWDRLYPFYREVMDGELERILVVSHGTTLSFLQSMLMGYNVGDRGNFRFSGRSGSISKFIVDPDGRVTCCYINMRIY